jgi:hypothetical protein
MVSIGHLDGIISQVSNRVSSIAPKKDFEHGAQVDEIEAAPSFNRPAQDRLLRDVELIAQRGD